MVWNIMPFAIRTSFIGRYRLRCLSNASSSGGGGEAPARSGAPSERRPLGSPTDSIKVAIVGEYPLLEVTPGRPEGLGRRRQPGSLRDPGRGRRYTSAWPWRRQPNRPTSRSAARFRALIALLRRVPPSGKVDSFTGFGAPEA